MRIIAISLALLSLGSAHAFAETLSGSKTDRADFASTADVANSNFASRFDDATAAIARMAKETQRLKDEAKASTPIVNAANVSKTAVK